MEQDPNPKVRGGQTLLVLLLILLIICFMALIICFMALIYYRSVVLAFIGLIIMGLMFKLDKKINEIKKEDGHERKD